MKIETLVKLSNTKDGTDLYSMFCAAARGEWVSDTKDSQATAELENRLSKAFDDFAQKAFDAGVEYERKSNGTGN